MTAENKCSLTDYVCVIKGNVTAASHDLVAADNGLLLHQKATINIASSSFYIVSNASSSTKRTKLEFFNLTVLYLIAGGYNIVVV